MHLPAAFVMLSTLLLTASVDASWWCHKGHNPMECLPRGNGYIEFECDHNRETYVKKQEHACLSDKPVCKCFTDRTNEEEAQQTCECVSARARPAFPKTGIIRWNGTLEYSNNYDGARVTYLPGEVHKDSQGRFLLVETKVHWPTFPNAAPPTRNEKFVIVVPGEKAGAYTKYTGDKRWKKCTVDEIDDEKHLHSIWRNDERRYFHLIEEQETSRSNHVIQTWYQEVPADYEEEEWKLILDYDVTKKTGVPIKYEYEFVDHWGYEKKSIKLNYTYEPMEKVETSFNISDYCTSMGRRRMPVKRPYGRAYRAKAIQVDTSPFGNPIH